MLVHVHIRPVQDRRAHVIDKGERTYLALLTKRQQTSD